jgi:hypothetical protein
VSSTGLHGLYGSPCVRELRNVSFNDAVICQYYVVLVKCGCNYWRNDAVRGSRSSLVAGQRVPVPICPSQNLYGLVWNPT